MPVTVPAQLSVADGAVTVTEHSPVASAIVGADGARLSSTVTCAVAVATLPLISVAVRVTVFNPIGVWLPRSETLSVGKTSHSEDSVGKPAPGLVDTPLVTVDFLTNVAFTVVFGPLVHALPGSSPILPKTSNRVPPVVAVVGFLTNATASSPLKLITVGDIKSYEVVTPPLLLTITYVAPLARLKLGRTKPADTLTAPLLYKRNA